MATKTVDAAVGIFDDALQTFNDAVKSGVKVQEEIGKWWSEALDQCGPAEDWQKKSKTVLNEAIPTAQKNAEQWLKLVEQNYRKTMSLLKKAWETDADGPAIRAKTQELWEASLNLVRDNTQALAHANMKMMEVWAGMLRNGAVGQGKASK